VVDCSLSGTQGWIFLRQVSTVKIESLYSVAKPTKYSRHIGLTNQRIIGLRGPQCGKKACGVPHFEVIAMEQFVGTCGDIVSAITALKVQPGLDLQIIGSGNLNQTLQAASLIAT
jgi:hypothetical protein